MSFVVTQPDSLAMAACDPHQVDAAVAARDAAAALPKTAVVFAAAGEVSAFTATQFTMCAQAHQPVSGRAVPVRPSAGATLAIRAGSWAAGEAPHAIATG